MPDQVTKQAPQRSPGDDEEKKILIILPNGFNFCVVTDGMTSFEYNEIHFTEP